MHFTYLIQIQTCAKALVDRRTKGLGTTWMKSKLVFRCCYALSAIIQGTPSASASERGCGRRTNRYNQGM
jgi:hypothetical protein